MHEVPADVVTAVAALALLVFAIWATVTLNSMLNTLRAVRNSTEASERTHRLVLYEVKDQGKKHADEKGDDTDWAEKYQHLALRVAAVIDTDYQAPTTYNDGAALGYRDGAKAVVTDLRATLSEGA